MRAQRGSVSVEFAALLPLLAIAMLMVAQVGLLVSEQVAVQHAAREGARTAAVTGDDEQARAAALRAGNLDPERAEVVVEPAQRPVGTTLEATVRYRPVVIPLVERFVPGDIVLRAVVAMRSEHEP